MDLVVPDCAECGKPHAYTTEQVYRLWHLMKTLQTTPERAQRMMRDNSVPIDNLDDSYQKLAFTLYTMLVELAEKADAVEDTP